MRISIARLSPAALLAVAAVLYAADKPKPAPTPATVDPYTEVQPATESLDMTMYQRIRDEGLNQGLARTPWRQLLRRCCPSTLNGGTS